MRLQHLVSKFPPNYETEDKALSYWVDAQQELLYSGVANCSAEGDRQF